MRADGIDQLYVVAEGLVLGRVEGGSFTPMAQDGQSGILLDGTDFLGDHGSFGGEATAVSSERRLWALLESLPGTSYHLPRRRLYGRPEGDAERAVRETRSEPADEAGRRA